MDEPIVAALVAGMTGLFGVVASFEAAVSFLVRVPADISDAL